MTLIKFVRDRNHELFHVHCRGPHASDRTPWGQGFNVNRRPVKFGDQRVHDHIYKEIEKNLNKTGIM